MLGRSATNNMDQVIEHKRMLRREVQLTVTGILFLLAALFAPRSDAQTCPTYAPPYATTCEPLTPGETDYYGPLGVVNSIAAVDAAILAQYSEPYTGCSPTAGSSVEVGGGSDTYFGGYKISGIRKYSLTAFYGDECQQAVPVEHDYIWWMSLTCPEGFLPVDNSNHTAGVCYRPTDIPDEQKNLGGCDPESPEPPKDCPLAGNPINVATLNKFETQVDYVGTGRFPLVFIRYYNSRSSTPSKAPPSGIRDSNYLGAGWTATYFQFLHIRANAGTTYVTAYRPDGQGLKFAGTTGAYGSESDITAVLTRTGTSWQLKMPDGTLETYALEGRLLSIRSRGETLSLSYDGANRLTQITDNFGHVLQFEYSSSGTNARISALVDPAGYRTYYSTAANLTQVTYPDSAVRKYLYRMGDSVPHLLTGIIDENNSQFSYYAYDPSADGNAIETKLAGNVNRYAIVDDGSGYRNVTKPSGAQDTVVVTTIRGVQRLETSGNFCESCPPPTWLTYDDHGNVISEEDGNGNVTTYVYNTRNLETSRTEAVGATVARTITTQWHATHRLPTLITEPKRKTAYTYDADGNVLTRIVTDTSITPNVSRTWTFTYDSYGRPLSEDGPRSDVVDTQTYTYYTCTSGLHCGRPHTVTDALGRVKTYLTYNAHGQPTTIMDENGTITTIAYDTRRRMTSHTVGTETTLFEYWPTSLLKKVTLPDGAFMESFYDAAHRLIETRDALGNRLVYTLDNAGNRIRTEALDASGAASRIESQEFDSMGQLWKSISAVESGSQVTEFAYDGVGDQISALDPLGRQTSMIYDELNRLKEVTTGAGGLIKYGYDKLNNITSIVDPRNKTTSYTYNGFSQITQQVSPDSGTTLMTYDAAGNLKTIKDARNLLTTYSYDAISRVTTVDSGDQLVTLGYDSGPNGSGRLTSASDSMQSQAWSYDARGRVISSVQTVGSFSATTGYGYTNGLLGSMTTPSGQSIAYGYSADGKVNAISVNGAPILNSVLREPFGGLRQWTWGNATLAVRTHDTDGRLTLIDSGGDLQRLSYDEAGRITNSSVAGKPMQTWSYGYNAADALTTAQRSGATYAWTYDANSNRKTQTGTAATTFTIASANNRLTATTGSVVRTYTYDANGNVKTFGNRTLTYNNRGRLSQIAVAGVTTTYVYNSQGQRVKKSGALTRHFVHDEGGHLLGEYDSSGTLVQEIVWLDDIPVASLRPNGSGGIEIFYIHSDHLGTPRKVTRSTNGAVMWTWESDPFGQALPNENPSGQGSFQFNLRFAGQYFDAESGLHHNYFRDYDPATGRYMSSDPIGLQGGTNTYAYVFNRPTMGIDPFGLAYQNPNGGPCPLLTYPEHCEFVPDSDKVHEVRTGDRRKIQEGMREWEGQLPGWEPGQDLPSPILVRRGIMPNPGLQIGPTGDPSKTRGYRVVHRWGRFEVRYDLVQYGRCKCFDACGKVTWFSGAEKRSGAWRTDGKWDEWDGL